MNSKPHYNDFIKHNYYALAKAILENCSVESSLDMKENITTIID